MDESPYPLLAERLHALPNGFPPAPDDSHLHLLEKLFTPEEAALAASLRLTLETPEEIAQRLGGDHVHLRKLLKQMSRRGLITAGAAEGGLGFGLMPFVVGIYEMQAPHIDAELAALFEQYYKQAFVQELRVQPSVHRVIPVYESVSVDLEVRPYESASDIVAACRSWGVIDCICRKQKQLIGDGCQHPLDVCLVMSIRPGAFDQVPAVKALTQEEAMSTLRRAAHAGLVHSVSNNQQELWYVCNCCTCSCGILRGQSELGLANVIARSDFVNEVDSNLCMACGECVQRCQFNAITLGTDLKIEARRCTGCGVCVITCPEGALHLVPRPAEDRLTPPEKEVDWLEARAQARGIDLNQVR
jgi:Na+-translocating ferredoxin:NAD+ oxidoreductase subunit B